MICFNKLQYGFQADWGTMNMIAFTRQLQGKGVEQRMDLYQAFVDLTKVFDTENRNLLEILGKLGCPGKFIDVLQYFHDGIKAWLKGGKLYGPLKVKNGFKQRYIPTLTLYALYFTPGKPYIVPNIFV